MIFYVPLNLRAWGLRPYFPSEGRCAVDFYCPLNPSPQPGLNPCTLGPMASTLTITLPRGECHDMLVLCWLELKFKETG
jgi:hypothetical protein